MLDLNTNRKLYELKWFDGTVIHCRKPTQSFLMRLTQLNDELEQLSDTEVVKALNEIVLKILNNNTDKRVFTSDDVEQEMDVELEQLLIQDYFASISDELGK